jgi:hypothetical protein
MTEYWGTIPLTHLGKTDRKICSDFFDKYSAKITDVELDTRVGQRWPVLTRTPEWMNKDIQSLSKRRIDLAFTLISTGERFVCEITPTLTAEVVGRILLYQTLYKKLGKTIAPVLGGFIGRRTEPEAAAMATEKGIHIWIV